MSKRIDPVSAIFERYIGLSTDQQSAFAFLVKGFNRANGGKAEEPRKRRPPGAKNKAKAVNGAEAPVEGASA